MICFPASPNSYNLNISALVLTFIPNCRGIVLCRTEYIPNRPILYRTNFATPSFLLALDSNVPYRKFLVRFNGLNLVEHFLGESIFCCLLMNQFGMELNMPANIQSDPPNFLADQVHPDREPIPIQSQNLQYNAKRIIHYSASLPARVSELYLSAKDSLSQELAAVSTISESTLPKDVSRSSSG